MRALSGPYEQKKQAEMTDEQMDAVINYVMNSAAVSKDFNDLTTNLANTDLSMGLKIALVERFRRKYDKDYTLDVGFYEKAGTQHISASLACAQTLAGLEYCDRCMYSFERRQRLLGQFKPVAETITGEINEESGQSLPAYQSQRRQGFFKCPDMCQAALYSTLAAGVAVTSYFVKKYAP